MSEEAIVRRRLAEIRGVTRTWFEWEIGAQGMTQTLVVEVDFNTDPQAATFNQSALQHIDRAIKETLRTVVRHVRITPSDGRRGN